MVICVKNASENFTEYLESICNQQLKPKEIILVDDGMDKALRKQIENKFPQITLTNCRPELKKRFLGKRAALVSGIEVANSEYILLTDADCVPQSEWWSQAMIAQFENDTDFVLGFSPVKTSTPRLADILSIHDCCNTAWLYANFYRFGMPYMGVGRNLAYKKTVFLKQLPQYGAEGSHSGDDDLLVANNARKENTSACFNQNAFMLTDTPKTTKQFIQQKTRHLSTGMFYPFKVSLLLNTIFLARAALVFAYIFSLLLFQPMVASLFFVNIVLLSYLFLSNIYIKFGYRKHVLFIPLYEIIWVMIIVYASVRSIFGFKRQSW